MKFLKHSKTFLTGFMTATALSAASAAFSADEDVLPTSDDSIEVFWKAQFWTIYKNNSRRSCFIEWRGETSVIQAGLTIFQDVGYLGGFVKGIEPEEGERDVAIILNGKVYLGSLATVSGTLPGDYKGGYILFNEPSFVTDLEEAGKFIAFPDSPNVFTVTLKTPRNAVARARECMASF